MTARILIVEDNESDQEFIRLGFEALRDRVSIEFRSNGADALDYLSSAGRPDLILLDLDMPAVDGRTLLKRLKSSMEYRRIPAVVFSTSSSPDDIAGCYNDHANAYVVKPGSLSSYEAVAERLTQFWIDVAQT